VSAKPSRRLRSVSQVRGDDEQSPSAELGPLDGAVERDALEGAVERLTVDKAARRYVAEQEHAADTSAFTFPAVGRTLAHDLAEPPREQTFTIEGLHPSGGNTVLTAGFKVGKTTLIGNLVRSLVDDEPFLSEFHTSFDGRVAYLNYELDADTFRRWMRDIGIVNTDRVAAPLHLRGFKLPFWTEAGMELTANWLRENEVGFLIFDPTARAWQGLVDNENDNSQMGAFTNAVDELKRAAGVQDALLAAHTGRKLHEENTEHTRGASRLDDWADALWILTKDKDGARSLRATGRDVELEATVLEYNPQTRTLTSTGRTRTEERREARVGKALQALGDMLRGDPESYPPTSRAWRKAIEGKTDERDKWMKEAVAAGYVKIEVGKGTALLHKLTVRGGKALLKYERETA
jgi:hypothetical protein